MSTAVVLVCAGRGVRLRRKKDKAFVLLKGRPVFLYSLRVFSGFPGITHIVVVAAGKYHAYVKRQAADSRISVVEGGLRRQDSVYAGIRALPASVRDVIIHDGARPFLGKDVVKRLLASLKRYTAVSCGLPVKEALKKVCHGRISASVERRGLYAIQTPQGFRKDLLCEAYRKYNRRSVYDDAQLIEFLGRKVKVIEGDPFNIKITYPQDLEMAEMILEHDKHRCKK